MMKCDVCSLTLIKKRNLGFIMFIMTLFTTISFILCILIVNISTFYSRSSRNFSCGERSGDTIWGEKWPLHCHEWQRETVWLGKTEGFLI